MSQETCPIHDRRRVVHLTSVHPPFDVRIFHKECISIARAGYEVTLVAVHDRDETIEAVRLKAITRPSSRVARILFAPLMVCREALRQNADLFHFHDPELLPVGLFLRLKGKIVIYDAHENLPADVAYKDYLHKTLRRPFAWLANAIEKNSSRYFSAVVAATEPISRRFASLNTRTTVISNYPSLQSDSPAFPKTWAERSQSVAFAGTISDVRCIRQIVQAMGLLPNEMQAKLNLAGRFSPESLAKEMTSVAGWNRVNVLGTLDRPQIAELLNDARAGLAVYRPDPNFLDAAPIKLFEYMQAGIPVIASDFPGFRSILKPAGCGLLVNPLEPESIAYAIEYLLNHADEAEKMGQKGREAVSRRFNWATEEAKLLALYGDLLESKPRDKVGIYNGDAAPALVEGISAPE